MAGGRGNAPSAGFLGAALLAAVAALAGCRSEPPSASPSGAPRRVVTLAPNLTEIVFALGAGDRLVGVSEFSDYPEAARALPRVGGLEVDAEKVAALSPDLVLAISEGNAQGAVRALEASGLPVAVAPSGSLDAVLDAIRLVGRRLGRPEAGERLARDLGARRAAVRERVAGRKRPRVLLFVWPDPPQAAGGGTFLDDLLREAGAENLAGQRNGWPVLSAEYLATVPIDLVVVPQSPQTREAYARAFASGALSRGPISRARVVHLDESALTRPGPRAFDMLERLADAIP
ncbi:MAG: helical backbone metal receptor [Thermoanaerobaculia bacterium]